MEDEEEFAAMPLELLPILLWEYFRCAGGKPAVPVPPSKPSDPDHVDIDVCCNNDDTVLMPPPTLSALLVLGEYIVWDPIALSNPLLLLLELLLLSTGKLIVLLLFAQSDSDVVCVDSPALVQISPPAPAKLVRRLPAD